MFVADLARLGKIKTKLFKVQIVICRSNKSTPLILSKALVNWGTATYMIQLSSILACDGAFLSWELCALHFFSMLCFLGKRLFCSLFRTLIIW